jgi:glyoxylase-like metal-dependent hydrolase (beta-lactamase superfamily II)
VTYTGEVVPEGPWQDHVDGPVLIRKFSVESFDNNVYVIACTRTGEALIVDAAARADRILTAAADFRVTAVAQTHGHWDHVRAFVALKEAGLPIYGHRDDQPLYPGPIDRHLDDKTVLTVGDLNVSVIHLPGHTPGSLLFSVEGHHRQHLVSGDTLFPGGHGKTETLDDHTRIMDGLEQRIFAAFPDSTWVYPGHGADTTLGAERGQLGEWRARGW